MVLTKDGEEIFGSDGVLGLICRSLDTVYSSIYMHVLLVFSLVEQNFLSVKLNWVINFTFEVFFLFVNTSVRVLASLFN